MSLPTEFSFQTQYGTRTFIAYKNPSANLAMQGVVIALADNPVMSVLFQIPAEKLFTLGNLPCQDLIALAIELFQQRDWPSKLLTEGVTAKQFLDGF